LRVIANSLLAFICPAKDLFYEGKLIATNHFAYWAPVTLTPKHLRKYFDLQNLTILQKFISGRGRF